MSSRVTRVLLRLYPRRVRARYGDELLGLQDELRERGPLSRSRLVLDAIAGAFLARTLRQRTQLAAGVAVLIIAIGVAATAHDRGTAVRASTPNLRAVPATSCFVGGGSACSATSCAQFAAQGSAEDAVEYTHSPAVAARRNLSSARCATDPRAAHPPALFATDANAVAAPG
jgi:hypothetical protein